MGDLLGAFKEISPRDLIITNAGVDIPTVDGGITHQCALSFLVVKVRACGSVLLHGLRVDLSQDRYC